MNAYILSYLVIGFCFGVVSFSNRNLFSEGPTRLEVGSGAAQLQERAFWALLCTFLWPILLLTGLYSAWILKKRRRNKSF
jgi:hypothetical protein